MAHSELCNDCPAACVGQEYSTDCGYYTGPDFPQYGVTHGDSLASVLNNLFNALSPSDTVEKTMCTDDVVTTSVVRNPASACASQIVERDFTYSINNNISASNLSWDFNDVVSRLPKDYESGLVRVTVTGKNNGLGTSLVDSNKSSASFNVGLNQYPITVDFNLRVITPCGNLDLFKTIVISGPSNVTSKLTFMTRGVVQDDSGDFSLTTQLDGLESEIQQLNSQIRDLENIEVSGETKSVKSAIVNNDFEIAGINDIVSKPSEFEISYVDNNTNFGAPIGDIITDLYSRIKDLQDELTSRDVTIDTLTAEVASLNSQI